MTSKPWNKSTRFLFAVFSSFAPDVLRPDLWKIIILCWGLLPCYGKMKFIFAFYWHHLFLFWQDTLKWQDPTYKWLVLRYAVCTDHQMLKNSVFLFLFAQPDQKNQKTQTNQTNKNKKLSLPQKPQDTYPVERFSQVLSVRQNEKVEVRCLGRVSLDLSHIHLSKSLEMLMSKALPPSTLEHGAQLDGRAW